MPILTAEALRTSTIAIMNALVRRDVDALRGYGFDTSGPEESIYGELLTYPSDFVEIDDIPKDLISIIYVPSVEETYIDLPFYEVRGVWSDLYLRLWLHEYEGTLRASSHSIVVP